MSYPKSKLDSTPNQPSAQEREALEWLARLDRGLTPEQEAEFERWLAAHPQHSDAFGEFDGTWSLLNRVREAPEATAAAASGRIDPDAFAPRARSWRHVRSWSFSLLAAAAAMAIGYVGWWKASPKPPDIVATFAVVASTDTTGTRHLDLPDGSVVLLNRDSAVEVRFTTRERHVRLIRGEAHFTVAKNPAQAFIVRASAVDVRAVGTAFNVRLQSTAVEVLVTEGQVRVNDEHGRSLLPEIPSTLHSAGTAMTSKAVEPASGSSAGDRTLVAGEKVSITLVPQAVAVPLQTSPTVLASADIDRVLAWQGRNLEFVSASLGDMIAEFNRHNRQQLVIEDQRLAEQHFGGTFRADDLAGFVRMLEAHFSVVAERSADKIVLRPAH